jgi:hypothetical protein
MLARKAWGPVGADKVRLKRVAGREHRSFESSLKSTLGRHDATKLEEEAVAKDPSRNRRLERRKLVMLQPDLQREQSLAEASFGCIALAQFF